MRVDLGSEREPRYVNDECCRVFALYIQSHGIPPRWVCCGLLLHTLVCRPIAIAVEYA
jgi:hypothetical protein